MTGSPLSLLCLILLVSTVNASERLDIDALQTQFGSALQPEIRVREIDDTGSRRIALLTTIQVNQGRFEVFNPFGEEVVGRTYRVAVVDSEGLVVRNIIPTTTVDGDTVKLDSWLQVSRNGLTGCCHSLSTDAWNGIAPGRYSLVLIVNRRTIHGSPLGFQSSRRNASWEESWRDPQQDTPLCGSRPISVDIDAHGNAHFSDIRRFDTVDVEPIVRTNQELSLSVRIVSPEDAWMMIRGMNVYAFMLQTVSETVTKDDGMTADRRFRPTGGASGPLVSEKFDAVHVPKHGIVGGVRLYAGILEPGKYRVTVQVHESLYRDKLFANGMKVERALAEWPVRFQSQPREFVVE